MKSMDGGNWGGGVEQMLGEDAEEGAGLDERCDELEDEGRGRPCV